MIEEQPVGFVHKLLSAAGAQPGDGGDLLELHRSSLPAPSLKGYSDFEGLLNGNFVVGSNQHDDILAKPTVVWDAKSGRRRWQLPESLAKGNPDMNGADALETATSTSEGSSRIEGSSRAASFMSTSSSSTAEVHHHHPNKPAGIGAALQFKEESPEQTLNRQQDVVRRSSRNLDVLHPGEYEPMAPPERAPLKRGNYRHTTFAPEESIKVGDAAKSILEKIEKIQAMIKQANHNGLNTKIAFDGTLLSRPSKVFFDDVTTTYLSAEERLKLSLLRFNKKEKKEKNEAEANLRSYVKSLKSDHMKQVLEMQRLFRRLILLGRTADTIVNVTSGGHDSEFIDRMLSVQLRHRELAAMAALGTHQIGQFRLFANFQKSIADIKAGNLNHTEDAGLRQYRRVSNSQVAIKLRPVVEMQGHEESEEGLAEDGDSSGAATRKTSKLKRANASQLESPGARASPGDNEEIDMVASIQKSNSTTPQVSQAKKALADASLSNLKRMIAFIEAGQDSLRRLLEQLTHLENKEQLTLESVKKEVEPSCHSIVDHLIEDRLVSDDLLDPSVLPEFEAPKVQVKMTTTASGVRLPVAAPKPTPRKSVADALTEKQELQEAKLRRTRLERIRDTYQSGLVLKLKGKSENSGEPSPTLRRGSTLKEAPKGQTQDQLEPVKDVETEVQERLQEHDNQLLESFQKISESADSLFGKVEDLVKEDRRARGLSPTFDDVEEGSIMQKMRSSIKKLTRAVMSTRSKDSQKENEVVEKLSEEFKGIQESMKPIHIEVAESEAPGSSSSAISLVRSGSMYQKAPGSSSSSVSLARASSIYQKTEENEEMQKQLMAEGTKSVMLMKTASKALKSEISELEARRHEKHAVIDGLLAELAEVRAAAKKTKKSPKDGKPRRTSGSGHAESTLPIPSKDRKARRASSSTHLESSAASLSEDVEAPSSKSKKKLRVTSKRRSSGTDHAKAQQLESEEEIEGEKEEDNDGFSENSQVSLEAPKDSRTSTKRKTSRTKSKTTVKSTKERAKSSPREVQAPSPESLERLHALRDERLALKTELKELLSALDAAKQASKQPPPKGQVKKKRSEVEEERRQTRRDVRHSLFEELAMDDLQALQALEEVDSLQRRGSHVGLRPGSSVGLPQSSEGANAVESSAAESEPISKSFREKTQVQLTKQLEVSERHGGTHSTKEMSATRYKMQKQLKKAYHELHLRQRILMSMVPKDAIPELIKYRIIKLGAQSSKVAKETEAEMEAKETHALEGQLTMLKKLEVFWRGRFEAATNPPPPKEESPSEKQPDQSSKRPEPLGIVATRVPSKEGVHTTTNEATSHGQGRDSSPEPMLRLDGHGGIAPSHPKEAHFAANKAPAGTELWLGEKLGRFGIDLRVKQKSNEAGQTLDESAEKNPLMILKNVRPGYLDTRSKAATFAALLERQREHAGKRKEAAAAASLAAAEAAEAAAAALLPPLPMKRYTRWREKCETAQRLELQVLSIAAENTSLQGFPKTTRVMSREFVSEILHEAELNAKEDPRLEVLMCLLADNSKRVQAAHHISDILMLPEDARVPALYTLAQEIGQGIGEAKIGMRVIALAVLALERLLGLQGLLEEDTDGPVDRSRSRSRYLSKKSIRRSDISLLRSLGSRAVTITNNSIPRKFVKKSRRTVMGMQKLLKEDRSDEEQPSNSEKIPLPKIPLPSSNRPVLPWATPASPLSPASKDDEVLDSPKGRPSSARNSSASSSEMLAVALKEVEKFHRRGSFVQKRLSSTQDDFWSSLRDEVRIRKEELYEENVKRRRTETEDFDDTASIGGHSSSSATATNITARLRADRKKSEEPGSPVSLARSLSWHPSPGRKRQHQFDFDGLGGVDSPKAAQLRAAREQRKKVLFSNLDAREDASEGESSDDGRLPAPSLLALFDADLPKISKHRNEEAITTKPSPDVGLVQSLAPRRTVALRPAQLGHEASLDDLLVTTAQSRAAPSVAAVRQQIIPRRHRSNAGFSIGLPEGVLRAQSSSPRLKHSAKDLANGDDSVDEDIGAFSDGEVQASKQAQSHRHDVFSPEKTLKDIESKPDQPRQRRNSRLHAGKMASPREHGLPLGVSLPDFFQAGKKSLSDGNLAESIRRSKQVHTSISPIQSPRNRQIEVNFSLLISPNEASTEARNEVRSHLISKSKHKESARSQDQAEVASPTLTEEVQKTTKQTQKEPAQAAAEGHQQQLPNHLNAPQAQTAQQAQKRSAKEEKLVEKDAAFSLIGQPLIQPHVQPSKIDTLSTSPRSKEVANPILPSTVLHRTEHRPSLCLPLHWQQVHREEKEIADDVKSKPVSDEATKTATVATWEFPAEGKASSIELSLEVTPMKPLKLHATKRTPRAEISSLEVVKKPLEAADPPHFVTSKLLSQPLSAISETGHSTPASPEDFMKSPRNLILTRELQEMSLEEAHLRLREGLMLFNRPVATEKVGIHQPPRLSLLVARGHEDPLFARPTIPGDRPWKQSLLSHTRQHHLPPLSLASLVSPRGSGDESPSSSPRHTKSKEVSPRSPVPPPPPLLRREPAAPSAFVRKAKASPEKHVAIADAQAVSSKARALLRYLEAFDPVELDKLLASRPNTGAAHSPPHSSRQARRLIQESSKSAQLPPVVESTKLKPGLPHITPKNLTPQAESWANFFDQRLGSVLSQSSSSNERRISARFRANAAPYTAR